MIFMIYLMDMTQVLELFVINCIKSTAAGGGSTKTGCAFWISKIFIFRYLFHFPTLNRPNTQTSFLLFLTSFLFPENANPICARPSQKTQSSPHLLLAQFYPGNNKPPTIALQAFIQLKKNPGHFRNRDNDFCYFFGSRLLFSACFFCCFFFYVF